MKQVILKTYENSFNAHLAMNKLENEGIDCFIANENFSNLMPHYFQILGSGVHLYVNENDFERASKLVSLQEEFVSITCPNCGSSNIKFGFDKKKIGKWILTFFSTVQINNIKKHFICKECKTEFRTNVT